MRNDILPHTTFQEMLFIDGLGYHSEIKNRNRKSLLMKYVSSMPKRKDWSDMDHEIIRKHAMRRLLETA